MQVPLPSSRPGLRLLARAFIVAAAPLLLGIAFAAWASDTPATSFDDLAASEPMANDANDDDRVIGRVSGLHGDVYAEAPDGTRRRLAIDAPIYPGDRLVTARGGQLGVLSGDHYAGLNEETELSYALTPGGAPEVRLIRGHVRVIDAGDDASPAKLTTPGLEVAAAGKDIEVFAFPEKAHLVSMVCALQGQVQAASVAGESATVDTGGCAIAKPAEAIYAAGAAGVPLAVGLPGVGAGPPPQGAAANHFANPTDVAANGLLADVFGVKPGVAIDRADSLWTACDSPAAGAACGGAGTGPLANPVNPPSNPIQPGPPPPFPTAPSNPIVPGPSPVMPIP